MIIQIVWFVNMSDFMNILFLDLYAAERKADAKTFFNHVITPFLDQSESGSILEPVFVHMIKDEGRKGQVSPSRQVPKPVSSTEDVIEAVLKAKREKKVLRVAGSEHSVRDAIYPKDAVTLLLTGDLRKVEIVKVTEEESKKWLYCRIGAGCHLGKDPLDPHSDLTNSACYQVNKYGFGFPELGGIIHQSIGGFMMTGSAGGSLKHGFADVIQEIEFVDGNGKVQIADPWTPLWSAVGVSMGLFGIITHVTFRLPEMKLIEGKESNHPFDESLIGPNEEGESKLRESLESHEYIRVNWFPQKEVQRVQQWVGEQASTGEIIPYSSILSDICVAGMAAIALETCNILLLMSEPPACAQKLIGCILKTFVPLTDPKPFCDIWFETLPMDNEAHTDLIIKVDFTEIWMPLHQCNAVMDKLTKLFTDNPKAAGNFATEIYGAKESPFWLSMSHEQKMVRVDPYWKGCIHSDKREQYFSYFWDVLLDISGTRLHWGKYLPLPGQKCGNTTFNLAYLKSVYPKMDDWLQLREEMDPDQVFVSDYWRGILEIPVKSE